VVVLVVECTQAWNLVSGYNDWGVERVTAGGEGTMPSESNVW